MSDLIFVGEAHYEDIGGGFECDVLTLDDGTVLVINEDAIVLCPNIEVWQENSAESLGTIVRS